MSAIDPRGFRPLNPISSRGFGCLLRTTPPGLREGADRTLASRRRGARASSGGRRHLAGALRGAPATKISRCLVAYLLIAARAASIFVFTASRLKLAPFCIGG